MQNSSSLAGADAAVRYEMRGAVAIITLNRPERRNAINGAMREGLFDAWSRFEADAAAKVAVLTGAGDKAFCAGMDLQEASSAGFTIPPRGHFPVIGDGVTVS